MNYFPLKALPILLLFAFANKTASSQCTSVNAAALAGFTPYTIDSVLEAEGMRNGADYNGATLYYPIGGSGNYRSIVLVPGFVATQSSVAAWARFFAARGFVAMTIGTNNLTDFPNIRATALLDGMETMRQENNRAASPLYHNLDTNNIAVGGWSMGGGGAQLASVSDPRVKAVFAIAPYLETASLTAADLNHASPIFILSGQVDNVAPPAQHANVHYAYTPTTTKKVLYEIVGGDHNTGLLPSFGSGDVGNVVFAWMNLALKGDDCYCAIVKGDSMSLHATASKFLTNLDCGAPTSIIGANKEISLNISPNPSTGVIEITNQTGKILNIEIYNLVGKQILKTQLSGKALSLNLSKEAKGLFIIKATDGNNFVRYQKLVLR